MDPLGRVRAICLALPEATERLSHGEPTWFVRNRTFVMYADHHHDDRLAIWCHAPDGFQGALVSAEPDRFFVPPYVGHRGWIGVRLDVEVDWDEVATIVEGAYRMVAPRRLVAEVDARHPRGAAGKPGERFGDPGGPDPVEPTSTGGSARQCVTEERRR